MRPSKVEEKLGLASIRNRDWYIQGCNATTGDGLYEGLDWLSLNYIQRTQQVTEDVTSLRLQLAL